ncbi:MAG: STAS domain-containing protein [Bacteroidota bacterium]
MNFRVSQRSGVTILALDGNLLGGPDAGRLRKKVDELLEAGKNQIVLDAARVEFMNSSGLAMMIGALNAVRSAGGDLAVANASEKLATVITVTRLGGLFRLYDSVAAAASALRT